MKDDLDKLLFALNQEMALENIPFAARSFQAALPIKKYDGYKVHSSEFDSKIAKRFSELYPEFAKTWQGMGTGFVSSLDRVRHISLGVVFGTVRLDTKRICGFNSDSEFEQFCQFRTDIMEQVSAQALTVLLFNNVSIGKIADATAGAYWERALSYMHAISMNLANTYHVGFSSSETWLVFEYAAKSVLASHGHDPSSLRNLNHNKDRVLKALSQISDSNTTQELNNICNCLPDYTHSRYNEPKRSRIDVIRRADAAQFGLANLAKFHEPALDRLQIETV